MNGQTRNVIRALLDGMTGAGLFRRLNYPGAPRYTVDPRPVDEILRSTGLHKLMPKNTEVLELGPSPSRVLNEQARKVSHSA